MVQCASPGGHLRLLHSRLAGDVVRTEDRLLERSGRWPVRDQLIERVEATWWELERLGKRTERTMGGAAVVEG